MTTKQAAKYFGNRRRLALALGICAHAVYQWGPRPPLLRQYQIHELTGLPVDKKRK